MDRTVGVTELQRKFRAVLDEVVQRHTSVILTRGSRPEAVILPYDRYLSFVRADESGVLDRLDRALTRMADLNAKYQDEEVEADLSRATKTTRVRKHRA